MDTYIRDGKPGIASWFVPDIEAEEGGKENKKPRRERERENGVNGAGGKEGEDEPIAGLLVFKKVLPTTSVMELVVGYQMSVVRCAVGMADPVMLEVHHHLPPGISGLS